MGSDAIMAPGDIPLAQICGLRDSALEKMDCAIALHEQAAALAATAREEARAAAAGSRYYGRDRGRESAYSALFHTFDAADSRRVFREAVDAGIWIHILDAMGMRRLMDATALEEFDAQLAADVPEITEDNVHATIEGLRGDARLIFLRGLARAFSDLDRRFRSHDAFQLGDAKGGGRMVFTYVFDGDGHLRWGTPVEATIMDVERVFAVLDGREPNPGELAGHLREGRSGWGAKQTVVESRYFRIKGYKNGNAHLWFMRPDLVQKANLCLAEYYGEVLPDGVPREAGPEVCTALSRDLAFYASPPAVCHALVSDGPRVKPGEPAPKVLEPSAGTGNIVAAIRAASPGAEIHAVEVHAGRAAQILAEHPGVRVTTANFLALQPRPIYAAVYMNPPFSGTHWMDHVVHAYDWLAPGGVLRAVLPVSAELGQSQAHQRFRDWCEARRVGYRSIFEDLPMASFASSGTRVSTLILTLGRRHLP